MKPKRKWKLLWILLAILLILAVAAGIYLNQYYRAEENAMRVLEHPSSSVTIMRGEKRIDFVPEEIREGLIFYPGGKVQFEAYAPLMEALAERGTLCVLLRMPCNLAVLDVNAADGVREDYPEVEHWYIGGHSLGGTVASIYLADHAADFDGLLLLASYSSRDLSGEPLRVLSVYGSEDGVLNREKYEEAKTQLPGNAEEVILPGGCHAYFGCYGEQKGDGKAVISNKQQIDRTADCAEAFFLRVKTMENAA